MNLVMTVSAEGNQILIGIAAKPAAKAKMVDLETPRAATILASPTIALKYCSAKSTISCGIKPE
jgi:hypothetical protein